MFTQPPIKDSDLLNAIGQLQKLFTEEELKVWQRMRAITMRDIKSYAADDDQDRQSAFVIEGSNKTRDRNCDINFTVISTAINETKNSNSYPGVLAKMIEAIPLALKQLKEDISLFLKYDGVNERKENYGKALNYLSKIDVCIASLKKESVDPSSAP